MRLRDCKDLNFLANSEEPTYFIRYIATVIFHFIHGFLVNCLEINEIWKFRFMSQQNWKRAI